MKLVDVYDRLPHSTASLLSLLAERRPEESISHKIIPDKISHASFVLSRPYLAWYMIEVGGFWVGAIYLSHQREIGIGIFNERRGNGYATKAIRLLMKKHPGKFLANINPANQKSIDLFAKLGARHIQNTYEMQS